MADEEKSHKNVVEKYGFLPREIESLVEFVDGLNETTHVLAEKHYYQEALSKRVFGLTLACEELRLRADRLQFLADALHYDEEKHALVRGLKSGVTKSDADEFHRLWADVRRDATRLHADVLALNQTMRGEYEKKDSKRSEF